MVHGHNLYSSHLMPNYSHGSTTSVRIIVDFLTRSYLIRRKKRQHIIKVFYDISDENLFIYLTELSVVL